MSLTTKLSFLELVKILSKKDLSNSDQRRLALLKLSLNKIALL